MINFVNIIKKGKNMSTVKVKDFGENTTSARYYISGIVANSDLEKNLMRQLGTQEKSKNGAIKCTLAPYNILNNLGVTFVCETQESGSNSNANTDANAAKKQEHSDDKIWYAKENGVGMIFVRKASLKDNQTLRTSFKQEFNAAFNKNTSLWEIKPENGVTHNIVIEWFSTREAQPSNQAANSNQSNQNCSQDENTLIINVSKDTATALKIISDALNNGTKQITIAVKN